MGWSPAASSRAVPRAIWTLISSVKPASASPATCDGDVRTGRAADRYPSGAAVREGAAPRDRPPSLLATGRQGGHGGPGLSPTRDGHPAVRRDERSSGPRPGYRRGARQEPGPASDRRRRDGRTRPTRRGPPDRPRARVGLLVGEEGGETGQRRGGALAVQRHRDRVDAAADALVGGAAEDERGIRPGRPPSRRRGRRWGVARFGQNGGAGRRLRPSEVVVSGTLKWVRTPFSARHRWPAQARSRR